MIAIIQYNAGNIRSVQNALNRLGYESVISDDPTVILAAEKVIFPGVGEASSAMQYLKSKGLDQLIPRITQPFLGICLGQQLMCRFSEEGNTPCLGIFDAQVCRFPAKDKVPHMGWNCVRQRITHPLWHKIANDSRFYFVHSYYVEPDNVNQVAGATEYGHEFAAALSKGSLFAVQFHPEKSQHSGLQLLDNFLHWDGNV